MNHVRQVEMHFMINVLQRLLATIAIAFMLAAVPTARAQDGLAGELDDLLGLGGNAPATPNATQTKPETKAAEPVAAEPAAVEAVPAAAEAAPAVVEAVPAAAEAAPAVVEAVPAAVEAVPAAAEAVPAVVEAVPAAAEAVPAVVEAVPAAVEAVPAAVEAAPAVVEAVPAAAEAAPAVVEAVVEAVPAAVEAVPAAVEAAPAVVEAVVEAVPAAVEAVPAVVEAAPAEAAPAEAAAAEAVPAEVAPAAAETAPADVAPVAVEAVPSEAAPVGAVEAPVVSTGAPGDIQKVISEIDELEIMRRRALDAHGRSSLENARKVLRDGNYPEAQRLYEEAAKFITRRPGNEAQLDEAETGVAESIYRQAGVLWKKGDREKAVQLARQARDRGHAKAPKMVADIQNEIDNPPQPPPPKVAKRWNENAYRKNREQVERQLGKAREYYITGEYDLARNELELILKDNPYEQDAVEMLKRVADRAYDVSSSEFATTRSRMMDDVRQAWTPKRYAIDVVPVGDAAGAGRKLPGEAVGAKGLTQDEVTQEKMKGIVIPEISFNAANINDVVEFFNTASREFDNPELPPENRGVSFVLKLPNQEALAPAPAADPFAAAPAAVGGVPPITLRARYVNLLEALNLVTDIAGLKFRVRGKVVVIMPLNMADRDMATRSYTVLPSIQDRASSVFRELGTSRRGGAGGDPFAAVESAADSAQIDWKQLFSDMGVQWPDGSSISYIPSINKMRVFNTPENLADVEKALEDLNVTPRQIEIEARFVEVSQTDLESIGFDWLLTDDWELAHNSANPQERIKIGAGSGSTGLRYASDATPVNPTMSAVADNVLSVASVLTNPELSFVLHMLSQKANTDLLSAPKVVTKNSQEAIIKVVTEFIYPTEYDITENNQNSGDNTVQNVVPMVEPGGFEMREVGVILQVVPEVSADGQMIDLMLNPQIISEPTWRDYGFDYQLPDTEPIHVRMEQPFFQVRSISTSISIYNGATVVMGGMITESRTEVDDKIPLLGDVPLLGRLFRSRYEQSEKRNLLIFVTARLVDPAGRSLKTQVDVAPTAVDTATAEIAPDKP